MPDTERTPRSSPNENRTTKPAPSHGKTHGRVLAWEVAGQADPENPSTPGKPRGSLNSAWVMQLMGWPDEYAAELTRLLCEWSETVGATRSQK